MNKFDYCYDVQHSTKMNKLISGKPHTILRWWIALYILLVFIVVAAVFLFTPNDVLARIIMYLS